MAYTKKTWVSKETITAAALNNIEDGVQEAITGLTAKANAADVYTKAEVDGKLTSAFTYKGSVATADALPTEGNKTGDVYNVEDTGVNYAWDGEKWDSLSGTVDLTGYLTKDEAGQTYVTQTALSESLAEKANTTDLEGMVKYSPFVYNDQTRKTIQLANYDSLSGVTTQGVGVNLAMVSQWDKADFGSMQVTMNLNSKDGIVQLNDEKVLATVDQIPDVSIYATAAALAEGLEGKQDKGDYALKNEIPTVPTVLPNPNALTIKYNGQVAFTYDGSKAETGSFIVNGETVPVTADNAQTLKAYIDAGLAEKQAAGDYALKSDVPSVEGLATDESVDQKIAEAQAATGIVYLGEFSQAIVAENKAAEAGIFDTAENRVLVYTVNGQNGYIVNNVQADQTTQFLTWNGKQYVRSVTASGASAWTALNAVKLQGKAIVGPKFFALTTESASDDIKAAMTSGTDNLITEDDLNECLKKGYLIDEYSMQSGSIIVGFNGQGFTFTYVGFPNPVKAPALMTCVVSVADGVYKVLQNATKGTIVTSANLASYIKTDATVTGLTAQVEQLNTALEGKQDKGDYATNEIVEAEFASYDKTIKAYVDDKLTAVYTYKGSVATASELPQEHEIGDVWNIEDTGANVAWDGNQWDNLGATVDLSAYAKTETVTAELAKKANLTDIPEIPATLPNPNALTIKYNGQVAFTYDGSQAETGNFVINANTVPVSDSDTTTIKTYVDTELAKKQATGDYALKSEVPPIEGLATQEALTQGLAGKANTEHTHEVADVDGLQATLDAKTITVGHVGLNEDSVEIKQGESVVAQLTVPYYPLKVNASLFIDDGSFYDPEGGLGGHPDYFDNVKWSGGDNLTEEQLAKGPFLLITGTNTTDEEGTKILTNLVSLGKDSALGKVYATKEELEGKADVDHTHYTLPSTVSIPLITLQDKVYTEAEICGWFGVEDVTGLKGLIAQPHQFVVSVITSSGSVGYHNYQIPFQYVYVDKDSKSLKAIAVGLNPNNDTVSKIVLEANFDGTVIEGASNVKVTYTSLE